MTINLNFSASESRPRPNPQVVKYGCLSFLLDVFATALTSGLWLIWIIIRQSKRNR